MRLLFEIIKNDYDPEGSVFIRPSVRSIIIRGGVIGMVHSIKYNYYKFPGGGIEPGEGLEDALVRETISVQRLDDYEAEEHFTLEFVDPIMAIAVNRTPGHGPKDLNMIEREAHVLELLIKDGCIK